MAPKKLPPYKRLRRTVTLDASDLGSCSDSELVELARKSGFPTASRAMHRDDLLGLLLGETSPPLDPLETIRKKTHKKVRGQSLLRTVMNCDLNCPLCPHDRVVQCYSINHDVVDAVNLDDPT